MKLNEILRWVAFGVFVIVGILLCLVDDTPDVFDILAGISGGLAMYVLSTVVKR